MSAACFTCSRTTGTVPLFTNTCYWDILRSLLTPDDINIDHVCFPSPNLRLCTKCKKVLLSISEFRNIAVNSVRTQLEQWHQDMDPLGIVKMETENVDIKQEVISEDPVCDKERERASLHEEVMLESPEDTMCQIKLEPETLITEDDQNELDSYLEDASNSDEDGAGSDENLDRKIKSDPENETTDPENETTDPVTTRSRRKEKKNPEPSTSTEHTQTRKRNSLPERPPTNAKKARDLTNAYYEDELTPTVTLKSLSHLQHTTEAAEVSIETVLQMLQEEKASNADQNEDKITKTETNLSRLQDIAETACVSIKTVLRVLKEEKQLIIASPIKNREEDRVEIDYLNADAVRSNIQNFYLLRKEVPTLVKLGEVLKEQIGFNGCLKRLRKLLLKLGYKCKTEKKRTILIERHDLQMQRLLFLKKMFEHRAQGRPIVYTDENFLSDKNNILKSASRNRANTTFKVLHAGTKQGLLNDTPSVYKALKTRVHYSKMDFDSFKWLNEKLLPNLPNHSVIVLENSSYQNTRVEKLPELTSNKNDMQTWLRNKGIQFERTLLKVELYDIIKKNKKQSYTIDDYIRSKGYDVIRLPSLHPELNAIKNIWGVVKSNVKSKIIGQNLLKTGIIVKESLEEVTSETWQKTCEHVEKIEREYLKCFDLDYELVIRLENDDRSESELELSSDDD